jgi:hypothetical protein
MTKNVTGVMGYVMGYVMGKHRANIGLLRVLWGFMCARACECDFYNINLYQYISHAHEQHPITPVTPITRLYTCASQMLWGTCDPITPHHTTYSL